MGCQTEGYTKLQLGKIDVEEATQNYTQCLVEIPHVLRKNKSRT